MKHHRPFTLWVGMYVITTTLFWVETGNIGKGALLGLLSATLKTVWGLLHGKWFGKGDCDNCRRLRGQVVIAEGLEVNEGHNYENSRTPDERVPMDATHLGTQCGRRAG